MSSGFVSESELAERRRIRQEEWEKVRQPDQPLEAPEEQYDHRSLYERLEEQKQKKQQEYEEAHKLKNMVKGLDDDEIEFLDLVDQKKLEAEQQKELQERQELLDFRQKVEKLREKELDQKIQSEINLVKQINSSSSNVKPQQKLLKGVVVKRKTKDESKSVENKKENKNVDKDEPKEKKMKCNNSNMEDSSDKTHDSASVSTIGIIPGLSNYADSSDESDNNSS